VESAFSPLNGGLRLLQAQVEYANWRPDNGVSSRLFR
jgi:hypothetical protein